MPNKSTRAERRKCRLKQEIGKVRDGAEPSVWLLNEALKEPALFKSIYPVLAPTPVLDLSAMDAMMRHYFDPKITKLFNTESILYGKFHGRSAIRTDTGRRSGK